MNRKNSKNSDNSLDFNTDKALKQNTELKTFEAMLEKVLKEKYNLSPTDKIKTIEKDEALIPTSIFNETLGGFETISKYLKENLNFSNKKISFLTGRNAKSVWQALNCAQKKYSQKFIVKKSEYYFPATILQNKKLSILENVVSYLKENYSLTYHTIGLVLSRDERTIWTVYNRAKRKNDKN